MCILLLCIVKQNCKGCESEGGMKRERERGETGERERESEQGVYVYACACTCGTTEKQCRIESRKQH